MAGSLRYPVARAFAAALIAIAALAATAATSSAEPVSAKTKIVLVSSTWDPEAGSFDLLGSLQTRSACRGKRVVRIVRGGMRIKTRSNSDGDFVLEDVPLPGEEALYRVTVARKRLTSDQRGAINCEIDDAGLGYHWVESGITLSYDGGLNAFLATVGNNDPTCVDFGDLSLTLFVDGETEVGSAPVLLNGSWTFELDAPPAPGSYDIYRGPYSPTGATHLRNGGMIAAACAAIDSNEVLITP